MQLGGERIIILTVKAIAGFTCIPVIPVVTSLKNETKRNTYNAYPAHVHIQ